MRRSVPAVSTTPKVMRGKYNIFSSGRKNIQVPNDAAECRFGVESSDQMVNGRQMRKFLRFMETNGFSQ